MYDRENQRLVFRAQPAKYAYNVLLFSVVTMALLVGMCYLFAGEPTAEEESIFRYVLRAVGAIILCGLGWLGLPELRTLILTEQGCEIRMGWMKRCYKWDEIKYRMWVVADINQNRIPQYPYGIVWFSVGPVILTTRRQRGYVDLGSEQRQDLLTRFYIKIKPDGKKKLVEDFAEIGYTDFFDFFDSIGLEIEGIEKARRL